MSEKALQGVKNIKAHTSMAKFPQVNRITNPYTVVITLETLTTQTLVVRKPRIFARRVGSPSWPPKKIMQKYLMYQRIQPLISSNKFIVKKRGRAYFAPCGYFAFRRGAW